MSNYENISGQWSKLSHSYEYTNSRDPITVFRFNVTYNTLKKVIVRVEINKNCKYIVKN